MAFLILVVLYSLTHYAGRDDPTIATGSPSPSAATSVISGEARACALYRAHAGEPETGTMTQGEVISWARDIKEGADAGIYHRLQLAANALLEDAKSSPSIASDEQLGSDQAAVLHACSSLGL